jgi:Rrf2 family protein
MTISQTAEYALRAVLQLAASPTASLSTRQIARLARVPGGYLSKVLQTLAHAGLLESRPGRLGGFVLARPPTAISVLDVIDAVDPIGLVCACPLGLAEHNAELCPLHRRLNDALGLMRRAFAETTIAELLAEPPHRGAAAGRFSPAGMWPPGHR